MMFLLDRFTEKKSVGGNESTTGQIVGNVWSSQNKTNTEIQLVGLGPHIIFFFLSHLAFLNWLTVA